ncbi:non-structural maintenance of chromosomes element 1 homolog [Aricia agestis]|uniref:non-structural maintenance of chromosomes element 1 homolog n=1 Tax=Aricia agestis TaxID=91739 RepID=UPI001C202272|nr:non-structural maintenance of chromosomes element 1 homolog [Aricia agestis]XP_041968069.1 non-structural maintenance of chromosomes element 1 homolog [Aricia agestis]
MTYSSTHRFLLRSVASCGALTLEETKRLLINASASEEDFIIQDLISEINEKIRPFQQTIKIVSDEFTNEEVVVFLSLGYDDATKSQNIFSATELEYFRILLEKIMTTESRQVTSIHALNLVSNMKLSFTKTDAQRLLNTWCKMHYLVKNDSNYALGIRGIYEFEGYLRENLPDSIEECCLCKNVVYRGYNCPGCAVAIHTRCLNRYLEKVEKWPCCKIDFHADQLERLTSERLTQNLTQTQTTIQHAEETMSSETMMDDSEREIHTQDIIPEISQRVTRKRKRNVE